MATKAAVAGLTVAPGHRLCVLGEFNSGPGTYVRGDFIYASLVGTVAVLQPVLNQTSSKNANKNKKTHGSESDGSAKKKRKHEATQPKQMITVVKSDDRQNDTIVPKVGDRVIAKVLKITPRFAKVEIASVGRVTLRNAVRFFSSISSKKKKQDE